MIRCIYLYFISANNISLQSQKSINLTETTIKLTPTNYSIVGNVIGTQVNFTCSYTSAEPMEIEMHTLDYTGNYNMVPDSQYGSYINSTMGAERVLMVKINRGLHMVVCSVYNKQRVQIGQISTVINTGAKSKQIILNWFDKIGILTAAL